MRGAPIPMGKEDMNCNKFHSPVDWREIDKLRTQFKCSERIGPGPEGVGIDIPRLPIVPVHVNGQGPFSMIFETGYIGYMLTDSIERRFSLPPDEKRMVKLDRFSIGDTCWRGMQFGLDDAKNISNFLDRRIDGMLGNLFWMLQCVTPTLDYPSQRLSLAPDGGEAAAPSQSDWVPMEIVGFCPFVPVMVNGQGPFRFHIDTGAGGCILSQGTAEKLNVSLGEPCRLRGTLIDDPAHKAVVESLSVGPAKVDKFPVNVSMETLLIEKNVQCPVDGTIGTTFLKHFSVTFDYARERFGLAGVHRTKAPPDRTDLAQPSVARA